jgi:hypothetical protein
MAFRTLLYRYFFFGWMFRDASRGNLLERAAAWRHNQERAHWLLTYMRRWLFSGLLLYALGNFVEMGLAAPVASAFFYVPGALSVPINAVIATAWLGLKALPGPF